METNRTLARTLARELTSEELLAVAGGGRSLYDAAGTSCATCSAAGEDDCAAD